MTSCYLWGHVINPSPWHHVQYKLCLSRYEILTDEKNVKKIPFLGLCLPDVPDPPTNVQLKECDNRIAEIGWTPASENNSPVRQFVIEYNTSFSPHVWQRAKSGLSRYIYSKSSNFYNISLCAVIPYEICLSAKIITISARNSQWNKKNYIYLHQGGYIIGSLFVCKIAQKGMNRFWWNVINGTKNSGGGSIHARVPIHAHPQFSLRFIVFDGKYICHVIDNDKIDHIHW